MYSSTMLLLVLLGIVFGVLFQSEAANPDCTSKNQLSKNPHDIGFYFYPLNGKPDYEQKIEYNNTNSLAKSAFNKTAIKTVFIIHGFTDNRTVNLPAKAIPAYLASKLKYNYIVVDWGLLSGSCYMPIDLNNVINDVTAAALYAKVVNTNIPIVAKRTAEFINFLKVDPLKVHIVGHSLGAHVSGQAGNIHKTNYKKTIARITGLDPAGPLFTPSIPGRNLNKNCATFVDVIHTNMGENGDTSVDGHADFYPNGGANQPGCSASAKSAVNAVLTGKAITVTFVNPSLCSHEFAPLLYATSLKKEIPACKCSTSVLPIGNALKTCLKKCAGKINLGADCPITYDTPSNPIYYFYEHNYH